MRFHSFRVRYYSFGGRVIPRSKISFLCNKSHSKRLKSYSKNKSENRPLLFKNEKRSLFFFQDWLNFYLKKQKFFIASFCFILLFYFICACTLFFILFLFLENCTSRLENNKTISYSREKLFIALYWMIFTRGNAPICPHFHDSYTNSSRCVSVFERLSRRRWIASVPSLAYWSLLFSFFIESIKLKPPLLTLLEHRYASAFKRDLVHTTWLRFELAKLAKKSQIAISY